MTRKKKNLFIILACCFSLLFTACSASAQGVKMTPEQKAEAVESFKAYQLAVEENNLQQSKELAKFWADKKAAVEKLEIAAGATDEERATFETEKKAALELVAEKKSAKEIDSIVKKLQDQNKTIETRRTEKAAEGQKAQEETYDNGSGGSSFSGGYYDDSEDYYQGSGGTGSGNSSGGSNGSSGTVTPDREPIRNENDFSEEEWSYGEPEDDGWELVN